MVGAIVRVLALNNGINAAVQEFLENIPSLEAARRAVRIEHHRQQIGVLQVRVGFQFKIANHLQEIAHVLCVRRAAEGEHHHL